MCNAASQIACQLPASSGIPCSSRSSRVFTSHSPQQDRGIFSMGDAFTHLANAATSLSQSGAPNSSGFIMMVVIQLMMASALVCRLSSCVVLPPESAPHNFAHCRQRKTFVLGEGQQRPQRRDLHYGRIGCGYPISINQASRSHRLTLVPCHAGFAKCDGAGCIVQQQRERILRGNTTQKGLVPNRLSRP